MLGRYPRRVRAVEVEQLLAEYRQPEVVICFRRPLHLTTSLYRRLDTHQLLALALASPLHHTIILRPVGGSRYGCTADCG
jgi:hypothetical protein